VKALVFDMCVDRRHVAPAFLALATGAYISEWINPISADTEVLALARSLFTEDADFGDLIYRDYMAPPAGVILVMTPAVPKANRADWIRGLAAPSLAVAPGHFVVLGPTRYRYRPFPTLP
jgi:hypothetical protein